MTVRQRLNPNTLETSQAVEDVTEAEVKHAVMGLKTRKTPGPDGIVNELMLRTL